MQRGKEESHLDITIPLPFPGGLGGGEGALVRGGALGCLVARTAPAERSAMMRPPVPDSA